MPKMADSSDSYSIDIETSSPGGKEHLIETATGFVSVAIFGDPDKPALITYPDIALNHMSCFQGLFLCPEAFSLLLDNFCIYHISPPGHEWGAAPLSHDDLALSADDLADQVADVLDYFGLGVVMCLGVTAGAYVLTLFSALHDMQSVNVLRYLEALDGRADIIDGLRKLQCRTLIFVGENSAFHSESLHMTSKLDRRFSALIEVGRCGSLVTEEQPEAMLTALEYFLMGYGVYRPSSSCELNTSPRSPLSPTLISADLYNPESMGLKLKPIRTRVSP